MTNWITNIAFQKRYFIPLFLLAINFILKIWHLDFQSIANDEPFSIFFAQLDVHSIISELSSGNNPPFFEIMLHFWLKCFGISAFSVRFLPFLFSVFTVFIIYKIANTFFSFRVAIFSSLIYTFSNYHQYFAHEARVYSFFTMMTCISMFAFLKILNNQGVRKYWILLLFSNLLLSYSHYFGLFIPFIQGFCLFFFKELRLMHFKNFIISNALFVLFYIPIIPILIQRFLASTGGTWVKPASFEDFYTMLWRFSNVPVLTVLFIFILLAAFLKWIFSRTRNVLYINSKVLLVWFILPYLSMFFVSLKYLPSPIPIFLDRYLVFISIAFYLCVSIALSYIIEKVKYGWVFYLLPTFVLLGSFQMNIDNKRNIRPVISRIAKLKTRNTKLVVCPENYNLNLAYYLMYTKFYPSGKNYKDLLSSDLAKKGVFAISNKYGLSNLDIEQSEKLIYLDVASEFSSPGNEVFDSLENYFNSYKLYEFPDIFKLYVFEKKGIKNRRN